MITLFKLIPLERDRQDEPLYVYSLGQPIEARMIDGKQVLTVTGRGGVVYRVQPIGVYDQPYEVCTLDGHLWLLPSPLMYFTTESHLKEVFRALTGREPDTEEYVHLDVLQSLPVEPCRMGMGCEEAGVCYAESIGVPEQCGRTRTDDDDSHYGSPAHAALGDSWFYRDNPEAW